MPSIRCTLARLLASRWRCHSTLEKHDQVAHQDRLAPKTLQKQLVPLYMPKNVTHHKQFEAVSKANSSLSLALHNTLPDQLESKDQHQGEATCAEEWVNKELQNVRHSVCEGCATVHLTSEISPCSSRNLRQLPGHPVHLSPSKGPASCMELRRSTNKQYDSRST